MSDLYASILGPAWPSLARAVRRVHTAGTRTRGVFTVRRGEGFFARLMGALLRMPPASAATDITLDVQPEGEIQRWRRVFGDRPLLTTQWADGGLLVEAMGLVQCWFRLREEGGALLFDQVRATFGVRALSVPLPRFLSPRITGRADPAAADRVHVDVRIHAPIAGLLVAYEGLVTTEEPA